MVSLSLCPALLVPYFVFFSQIALSLSIATLAFASFMIREVAAGLREELGQDKLALTLEELGLAPAASLTVQVRREEMSAP